MPLTLLLVLVIGGISAITLLLHLTGRSERVLLTAATARAGWLRQFPGDRVGEVTVARDGHAALVATPDGPGLVWAFGSDTVARRLDGCSAENTRRGLRLRLHDHTAPTVTLDLTGAERHDWLERITRQ
ncbi:hypothetical protein [Pukyongiella litopenaei]|uniref:Uncharacterized protein n=1 Tax=Pukyongiella litopenaei TaxID=2605946 RepID=A0A2S0MP80_9RHOB|nr:hypothetical protein [Pukyongiella litopenaei]AVO37699.1 hypothetical protein C6Y53_08275 [Pukyongiella litopenaei]